jgi:hypothetical protein
VLTTAAKARHQHGLIGAGRGEGYVLSNQRGFRDLAAVFEAVQQSMQSP